MATGTQVHGVPKTEFENVADGVIGVVLIDPDTHKHHGIAVKPGETVWLSEPEEIATANAPRRPEDNPFAAGWLKLKTRASEMKSARPIGSANVTFDRTTEIQTEGGEPPAEPPEPPPAEDLDQGNKPVPPPTEVRPPDPDTTGAPPPLPEGDPQRGARAPGEEVGTPEAVAKAGRRPAGRGQTVKTGPSIETPADGAEPGRPQAAVMRAGGVRTEPVEER
jgi:hypothetical protein